MAMRGALTGTVSEVHRNYHIPISNTAAATMVLENTPLAAMAHDGITIKDERTSGSCVKSTI